MIDTKWVFHNKLNKNGNVLRNKVKLVEKEYHQQVDINLEETYAHVTRLEAIRMLLVFSCILNFKVFQMDVKSVFLNSYVQEEVYVFTGVFGKQ